MQGFYIQFTFGTDETAVESSCVRQYNGSRGTWENLRTSRMIQNWKFFFIVTDLG